MLSGLFPDPASPRPSTRFSGWRIVVFAAIALGLTGPGQTAGVSVFVDPMMASLDLTRSQVSMAYLVGTLGGAVAMPRLGKLIDDRGTRVAMAVVGGLFAVVLAGMAGVTGIMTLTVGFVGIRMLGQGGLSLVSTTSVAPWFDRRRGLAIGVTTAIGSGIIALVPVGSEALISQTGWRVAWLVLSALILLTVVPIATFGLIDRPEQVRQRADGDPEPHPDDPPIVVAGSFTRSQALRTPIFWVVAGAVATTGMIGTGLAFHQISLLGEQGLTPTQAAGNFIPQTVAALTTTIGVGALIDKLAPRWVLLGSMLLLAGAMVGVPFVAPGWSAIAYGVAVGAAGSSARALEAASFPRIFGLASLGRIRGVVTAISVASTAFGPLALSVGYDLTGSYRQVLLLLLVVPASVAVAGFLVAVPKRPSRPADSQDLR
jgi:MFS family permease